MECICQGKEEKKNQLMTDEHESEGEASSLLACSCCKEKEELRGHQRDTHVCESIPGAGLPV